MQYQLDLIYIVRCVFDNFRICKAVFKNCPTSKIPSKDLQFSGKKSPKSYTTIITKSHCRQHGKGLCLHSIQAFPGPATQVLGQKRQVCGEKMCLQIPSKGTITYPTKWEKENHLQNWLFREYVSFQEGIQSCRGVWCTFGITFGWNFQPGLS